jgi:hypothetical protein
VVEVHVGEDDVTHLFWVIPQASDLAESGLVGVHWDLGDDLKHTEDDRRVKVVAYTGTGVYEHRSLRGLRENA